MKKIVFIFGLISLSIHAQQTNKIEPETSNKCQELLKAVTSEDVEKVSKLLETVDANCTEANPIREITVSKSGHKFLLQGPRTPLVGAARTGNLDIGTLLIEAKANVDYHSNGDETPLIAAAQNGNLNFIKYLVENGASVDKKLNGDGTALLIASRGGHQKIVAYLISQGANINTAVSSDGTPLIQSIKNGHLEIAKLLLESGADPNLGSPGDEYPMYHAIASENRPMIVLLEKYQKTNN